MIKGKLIFIGIVLLIIGGIFALVFLTSLPYTEKTNKGFIIGFASLANKMKSEKIGDVYNVYVLKESYTLDSVNEKISNLNLDLSKLKIEKEEFILQEKEYLKKCIKYGLYENDEECYIEIYMIISELDYEIEQLENKLKELNILLKEIK